MLDLGRIRSVACGCLNLVQRRLLRCAGAHGSNPLCAEIALQTDAIVVTVISSLISGLVGVAVSTWYFYRLERHKLKMDLARRLLGNRFSITSDAFSCAMNEVIAVFADSSEVLQQMGRLYEAIQSHGKPNAEVALIDFLKAVCKASGLTQATLNDAFLLKAFNARN